MNRKLTSEDCVFFNRLTQSAFCNPFSDEREAADREVLNSETSAGFEAVLDELLAELDNRMKGLEDGGRLNCNDFNSEEREVIAIGILFLHFHRNIESFDSLIRNQIKSGDKSLSAPFAGELFDTLTGYGFERDEASLYVAMFYQLRRAFYFISESLTGKSPCMKKLRAQLWNNLFTHNIRWYVRSLWNRLEDFSTILLGETGSGKGAAAYALGRSGFIPYQPESRTFAESFTKAFVAINLSQYPESLIESELFGHKKGAFTGAVEKHDGVFSRCSEHGAIFLDEIGDVSEPVQIKLLQVLQQRVFSPVGGHEKLRFSGRVIAATNKSLDSLRREGKFRDDFYYRLCSDQITVPPLSLRLQEMPSEMETLVRHILTRISGEVDSGVLSHILEALKKSPGKGYVWPGNVRELEQAVRRILLTGSYDGDKGAVASDAEIDLTQTMENGALTVQELTALYCKRLFARFGSYGEVARRTGLDWRTVKKYVGVLEGNNKC